MQDQHRAAARQSSSVVLIRDERHGKMMVRFRLCESKTLNVRSGVLALETLSCGQAEEILRATRRGLSQFCQSRRNPPRGFRGHVQDFDEGLFKKLRQNCQMVVTDCASSELLAQNIGAGSRKSSAGPEDHWQRSSTCFPAVALAPVECRSGAARFDGGHDGDFLGFGV